MLALALCWVPNWTGIFSSSLPSKKFGIRLVASLRLLLYEMLEVICGNPPYRVSLSFCRADATSSSDFRVS